MNLHNTRVLSLSLMFVVFSFSALSTLMPALGSLCLRNRKVDWHTVPSKNARIHNTIKLVWSWHISTYKHFLGTFSSLLNAK